jgi:hypothetical protein
MNFERAFEVRRSGSRDVRPHRTRRDVRGCATRRTGAGDDMAARIGGIDDKAKVFRSCHERFQLFFSYAEDEHRSARCGAEAVRTRRSCCGS